MRRRTAPWRGLIPSWCRTVACASLPLTLVACVLETEPPEDIGLREDALWAPLTSWANRPVPLVVALLHVRAAGEVTPPPTQLYHPNSYYADLVFGTDGSASAPGDAHSVSAFFSDISEDRGRRANGKAPEPDQSSGVLG